MIFSDIKSKYWHAAVWIIYKKVHLNMHVYSHITVGQRVNLEWLEHFLSMDYIWDYIWAKWKDNIK